MTLGQACDDPRWPNAFGPLRLLAATLVLVFHSWELTGRLDPLQQLGTDYIGGIGVAIFFAISGFLVTRSWCRTSDVRRFAVKRGLRLLPALIAMLLLVTFVLGPLVTSLSVGGYLSSGGTYKYAASNAVFRTVYALPGVFLHVPEAGVVNKSLWTLPLEVKAYALVAVFGLVGLLRRSPALLLAMATVLCLLCFAQIRDSVPLGGHVMSLAGGSVLYLQFLAVFLVSAAMYLLRHRIPLRGSYMLGAAIVWAATLPSSIHTVAVVALVPYMTLYAAYRIRDRLDFLVRPGDVSYGMYLYAFPIQQVIVQRLTPGPALLTLIGLPVTYLVALGSWRLIEKPALALKPGRVEPGQRPNSATTNAPWIGSSRVASRASRGGNG